MNIKTVVFLLLIMSSGCNFPDTQELTPPFHLPSSTPSFFTVTPSPTYPLTPTFPSYIYKPFSIVFLREGNLWVANIGERTIEKQLTFEQQEIYVATFSISPDGNRIVYIPYQVEMLNSSIKLVHISTGETETILGENDPYNEIHVIWLDDTKIAYINQGLVPAFTTENVEEITTYIIYDLISKKQVAITEHEFLSPSPDGRSWLTCTFGAEGCGTFTLRNLENGQRHEIGKSLVFGNFINWSPDSKSMLFHTVDSPPDDCTGQLVSIDAETLAEKFITPENKDVWNANFSPSGELLVYGQADIINFNICQQGQQNYWLMSTGNFKVNMIPAHFDKDTWDIHWTPDGKQLIFFYDDYGGREGKTLWSMNLDGSNLKPILANVTAREYVVLPYAP